MRVLRLDLEDGPVEMHPFVTVVRGMAPDRREELLAALAALPSGRAAVPGLVEAHGVLLDLSVETLELLDLAVDEVDVIVHAADLPGSADGERRPAIARQDLTAAHDAHAAAQEAVERARTSVAAASEALDAARSGAGGREGDGLTSSRAEVDRRARARADADGALVDAVAREQAASGAVLDAESAADAVRAVRADATRSVSVAAAALEAATDRRDPMAAAAVEAADAQRVEADAAVAATRAGSSEDTAPAAAPSAEEIDALRADRLDAEARVLALDTVDPFPVRMALEQLRSGGATEPVPDQRARALADELADVEQDLDHLAGVEVLRDDLVGGEEQAAARARLAAAEAEVAAAEAALRGPEIDPADVVALEKAHDELLDAREASERRFRRGNGAARIAAAGAAEQTALDRLGFATWSDYLMGHRRGPDMGAGWRLEQARAELAAAAAEVRALDEALALELRRAQLLDRRRELRDAAIELIGVDSGDDLVDALRHRRVAASETGGHLVRLRSALEATGLALGDEELPERTLGDLARVWLEERERADVERLTLEQRVADLDVRLAEAARARREAAAAAEAPAVSPMATLMAAVEEARGAADAARARLGRHEEAEAEVEQRRQAFEEAARDEHLAVAAVAEAEAAVVAARDGERAAGSAVAVAQTALEAARAAEADAEAQLAALDERLTGVSVDRVADLEADVEAATTALAEATAEANRRAAAVDAALATLASAEAAAADEDAEPDAIADAEDAEWFLLARLAAQRAVSFAGSVPLVLDDALVAFDADSSRQLLARLERMAATVQVVVVTEDLVAAAWAESIGPERATVVQR